MIARHRGEHHGCGVWQPGRTGRPQKPAPATNEAIEQVQWAAVATVLELASGAAVEIATRRARESRRRWGKAVLLVLAGVIGFGAHQLLVGRSTSGSLPATPRQWVDSYEAAAVTNPDRVCRQLFSPPLAAAYAIAAHGSCTRYFSRISATSVRVRRVLQSGGTAVLELHQTIQRTDWNVVLQRQGGGWRAVDVIPGRAPR